MKRHVFLLAGIAALAASLALAQTAASPAAAVDGVFARWNTTSPGCAVGVSLDGRSVLERAYGMADLERDVPNMPETIFEAGSVSKQFTAAAVLLLARDGKLSLDDPVRKYVPELPDYGPGRTITIRHMLTHTSGLRDWGEVAGIAGWPRGRRVHTHAHVLDIVSRQKALNFTPGTDWSYSNTGYNLSAIIVARVSGQAFADFSRDRIFVPLGMARTSWRDDYTRIVKHRAIAYEPSGSGYREDMPFENVHGNGGLLTTVDDLLKWTENLRTGAVGGPKFLEEMHRQARLTSGRQIEYASGLFVTRHKGVPEVSHGGATAGYRAFLARYPDQKLGVAVLCNAAHANPGMLAHQVADLYLGDAVASAAAPDEKPVTVDAAALGALAGSYRDARRGELLRLTVEGQQLRVMGGPPLVPVGDGRFAAGSMRIAFRPAAAGSARRGLDLISPDGDTLRHEPVVAWTPTAAQLAAFAGAYRSDEAEVTYTAAVADGRLELRDAYGGRIPLTPVYEDTFAAGGGTWQFGRDRAGRVTHLVAGSDRVWALRFERRP
jgi:CubicO group peptidase (beta-lactamase class C family)